MHGLIGKMTANPGSRDDLVALLAGMDAMPGCVSYVVAHDMDDPNGVWVTEIWESEEAHRHSLELPRVQEVIRRGRPLIAGFEHRFVTTPVGGTLP